MNNLFLYISYGLGKKRYYCVVCVTTSATCRIMSKFSRVLLETSEIMEMRKSYVMKSDKD